MGEYYGVVRTPNYLSHALERGSGAVGVYKNHKYIARAMTSSGKYRYFYSALELGAYKQQRMKQTNSLTKTSDGPAGAATASSGAKSLREKWEERRGLLGTKGTKGKGSGGSGGGGGSGSGSGGGSGGSKKAKIINRVKPQEAPKHYGHLSSGALRYQGENEPNDRETKASKRKKKPIKQTKIRSARGVIPLTALRNYRR